MPCRRQSSPTREGHSIIFFPEKSFIFFLHVQCICPCVVRQLIVGLSLLRPATTPLHLRPQLYHCKGKHATPAFDQPRCISKSTLLHCITRKLSHPSNEDRRRPLSFCWYTIRPPIVFITVAYSTARSVILSQSSSHINIESMARLR